MGEGYEVKPLTAGLYQEVVGIITKLDERKMRHPDLLFGEISRLLSEKGLLMKFLSLILGIEEEKATEIPVADAVGYVAVFFEQNATSMVVSGILCQSGLQEVIEESELAEKAQSE